MARSSAAPHSSSVHPAKALAPRRHAFPTPSCPRLPSLSTSPSPPHLSQPSSAPGSPRHPARQVPTCARLDGGRLDPAPTQRAARAREQSLSPRCDVWHEPQPRRQARARRSSDHTHRVQHRVCRPCNPGNLKPHAPRVRLPRSQRILRELSRCDLPFQCAHGRPTLAPLVRLGALPTPLES